VKDLTILIFAGDNSQSRSDLAGRLSIHLQSLAPIKILTPFEPKEYFGEWVKIEVLDYQGAMRFQVKELYKYFMTKYCLHCETDGFPINFDSWSDDFLKFDLFRMGIQTKLQRNARGCIYLPTFKTICRK
jgi:hypothetical protein